MVNSVFLRQGLLVSLCETRLSLLDPLWKYGVIINNVDRAFGGSGEQQNNVDRALGGSERQQHVTFTYAAF